MKYLLLTKFKGRTVSYGTGEYGPLNWPITARVLTKRYNNDSYNMMQLIKYAHGSTINGLKMMFSCLACCNLIILDVQQN